MSDMWLREISTTSTGTNTGIPFGIKALAMFLRFAIGYTNPTQSAGSDDFWSYEKTGSNGSINLTGSDKDFQDSTASSFEATDVGKWILTVDSTNPENTGLYEITARASATNITIDFRSGAAEYPTQNLGANLTWYLLADDYEVPETDENYFRLQTPHSNGWEIQVQYSDPGSDNGLEISLAADGDWGGSKLLQTVYTGVDDNDTCWFYTSADTEGNFINFAFHNSTNSQFGGFIVSNVLLYDVDRSSDESVALMGNTSSVIGTWASTTTYERVNDGTNVARGLIWDEIRQSAVACYMMSITYKDDVNGLTRWTSGEANSRTGNWDFIDGQPIAIDPDNSDGFFEIVGSLQGMYLCSSQIGVLTATDDDGTKDKFHINNGIAISWPGYTEQH
jgi:hypothetical protein